MRRRQYLLLSIVILDAMGIGIVFPTLPELLRSLLHGGGDVARAYGYLLAAYAATMLVASPILGVLSDRYGRRPVLLLSLFGTAADDLVMALAPTLKVLYLGRVLAGFTGANLTVTNAYLADITTEEDRAGAFGRMNACFGIGFIAGPILGGLAGMIALRMPFYLAAGLNLVGAIVCLFALPESRVLADGVERERISLGQLNPFAALRSVGRLEGVGRLLYVFCTMDMVGQIPAVLWVLYGTSQFGWTPAVVGSSFAFFGLLHAVCQATLPARAEKKFGRQGTVLAGIAGDTLGFVLFSAARSTVAAFGAIPFLCLGGVGLPALQAMLSERASAERQGELQGVLTSFNSLVAIVGPIVASNLYAFLRGKVPWYPGSIFFVAVLLYVPCVVLFMGSEKKEVLV